MRLRGQPEPDGRPSGRSCFQYRLEGDEFLRVRANLSVDDYQPPAKRICTPNRSIFAVILCEAQDRTASTVSASFTSGAVRTQWARGARAGSSPSNEQNDLSGKR